MAARHRAPRAWRFAPGQMVAAAVVSSVLSWGVAQAASSQSPSADIAQAIALLQDAQSQLSSGPTPTPSPTVTPTPTPNSTPTPSIAPSPTPTSTGSAGYDHVFLIPMENEDRSAIIGNSQAPNINALATSYAQAGNYHATCHPSLPNYFVLTSGSDQGDCGTDTSGTLNVPNLFGDLTSAGVGWKNYVENLPPNSANWNHGNSAWEVGNYAARHVPAVFYQSVMGSASERAKVVNYSKLQTDLNAGTVPRFDYVGLNLIDDGHSGTLGQADTAVGNTVAAIQASSAWTAQRSLILIVWDEDSNSGGSNQVALIAVAKDAKPGFVSNVAYGHLNALATIENATGDPSDRSGGAAVMSDLFSASSPSPTPTTSPTPTPTATGSPGARLFGPTSLWNTTKTSGPFFTPATGTLAGESYGLNNGAYDHPTYFAKSTDPVTTFHVGAGWGFPATTITSRAPAGMHPSSGSDAVMTVLLTDGTLLDMFGLTGGGTNWTATYYGVSDGVNGPGFGTAPDWHAVGTTAIGSPQGAGAILARDIAAGSINHALDIAFPYGDLGGVGSYNSVEPAVSNDDGGGPGPLPEGGLLLIPAGTPMPAGLSVMGQALWHAAQTFGVYITDQLGGQPEFYGDGSSAVASAFSGSDFTTVGQALRLVQNW